MTEHNCPRIPPFHEVLRHSWGYWIVGERTIRGYVTHITRINNCPYCGAVLEDVIEVAPGIRGKVVKF